MENMSPQVSTKFDTIPREIPAGKADPEYPGKIMETRCFSRKKRFTDRKKHDIIKSNAAIPSQTGPAGGGCFRKEVGSMKKLMLGNEAVARGLYEAGCSLISSYPGTPSTEITEQAARYDEIYCEWAPNEKVAMEVAFGAALAGKRSACVMKHVGVNVAADPLFTIAYTGINAGMVICVADDPGMHSSQNEQDSRHYAVSAKIPMLEPADSEEARLFAKRAFQLSEEYDTPVFLKLCTRISHSQSLVEEGQREDLPPRPYVKDIAKYVMVPGNARPRHPIVEERTRRLTAYAETTDLNREELGEDTSLGIITSSTCYQYAREVFGEKASILKLGLVNPLPRQKILDFAAKVDRLLVLEGKDALPLIGEFSQGLVAEKLGKTPKPWVALDEAVPPRPPVLCAGCPHRGLFYTLAKHKVTVLGDIGCYTLAAYEPLYAIETCECMGASVSSIHGFNKALGQASEGKTVAVLGDSTFMHSGMTGLANIAYNQSNSTVIILDNSTTGMTGHQENPTTGKNLRGDPAGKIDLETLCRAMGIRRVRVVDPYDLKATEQVVTEELAAEEPSVIITRRPCVLLKTVKKHPPYRVDPDQCKGCKLCMRIGCPAISWKEKKAVIDPTQCVGCGVCEQLCNFDAFRHEA